MLSPLLKYTNYDSCKILDPNPAVMNHFWARFVLRSANLILRIHWAGSTHCHAIVFILKFLNNYQYSKFSPRCTFFLLFFLRWNAYHSQNVRIYNCNNFTQGDQQSYPIIHVWKEPNWLPTIEVTRATLANNFSSVKAWGSKLGMNLY